MKILILSVFRNQRIPIHLVGFDISPPPKTLSENKTTATAPTEKQTMTMKKRRKIVYFRLLLAEAKNRFQLSLENDDIALAHKCRLKRRTKKKGQRISYNSEIKNVFEISKSDLAAWFLCRLMSPLKYTTAYFQSKRKKTKRKKKNPRRKRVVDFGGGFFFFSG